MIARPSLGHSRLLSRPRLPETPTDSGSCGEFSAHLAVCGEGDETAALDRWINRWEGGKGAGFSQGLTQDLEIDGGFNEMGNNRLSLQEYPLKTTSGYTKIFLDTGGEGA